MNPRSLSFFGLALCSLALTCSTGVAFAAETELLPRALLFGNPERTSPQISPDGKNIAFIAPLDGVLNVWVAPRDKLDQAKALTHEKSRPIRTYFWSADGTSLLYMNDKGGDENFLLYGVELKTGKEIELTPFEKTRAFPIGSSWQRPGELLVGLNHRDPAWHDVYLLDIKTGKLDLVYKNVDQYDGFVADDSLKLRYVSRSTPEGGSEIFKLDKKLKASPYTKVGFEDAMTTGLAGMTTDGKTLYMVDTRGRDKAAIVAVDVATDKQSVIAESDKADVGGSIVEPQTGRVLAWSVDYLQTEWTALDPAIKADIEFLDKNVKGDWSLASQSRDNKLWVLWNDAVTEPLKAVLYDRSSKTLSPLFTARPALEGKTLAPMKALEIKARDGLTLTAYLTLPPGADTNDDGRPESPLPMVLNVHGGPWHRDSFGYDAEAQWLANRGYAVLQVNFRGSTGFGKSFIAAADREWGGKMHDDLLDAVSWATSNGVAIADKTAIYGGSYGGYSTLVGMTFTPDTFACGVDLVGVSNLTTFMETIPPYWESFKEQLYRRIGDPRTPEGKELLKARSPVFKAKDIRRPLLIAQGANDPRVNKAESDQIVEAMKSSGIPVAYVLYPDEGHGFARPQNRTSFYAISEAFLSQCLGGRFEEVGKDFEGSSLQVLEGATSVPGLEAALKAGK